MSDRTYRIGIARRQADIATSSRPIDEISLRYPGWRVVLVCCVAAVFSWGFGFYGQGVYLAELQRLKGWPTSLIASASTAYYLFSAVLIVFVSDAIARLGPRRFLLTGMVCLAIATAAVGWIATPWQLYAVYLLMSFGWAAMSVAAITTLIGMWFHQRRGLAISLALNGASLGGVIGTPILVAGIAAYGLSTTLLVATAVMALVLVPMAFLWIDRPPPVIGARAVASAADADAPRWTRRRALRTLAFWTVTVPFALALLAQVAVLVHQIALLEPRLGRSLAGTAVAVTAIAAVLGRLAIGVVVDRLDQRKVGAVSFLTQAAALGLLVTTDGAPAALVACGLFGLSVGNVNTLPALIIAHEFDAGAFAMLVAFSTAIGQFTYAFGPGLLGLLRDMTGSYDAPLIGCAALEVIAAAIVLVRGRFHDTSAQA